MILNVQEYLDKLKDLVNLDSGSYFTSGIEKVADYMCQLYKEIGFSVEYRKDATGNFGTGLIAKNCDDCNYDVTFVGHFDTVFPEATVKERPFKIEGDRAYGPGVADMKSGILLMFYLAKAIKEEIPNIRLCVLMNGDEELGSPSSNKWLDEETKQGERCFVFEPGRGNNGFVKRRKGTQDIHLSFTGLASHAGNAPKDGRSAIGEMARWLIEIENLNDFDNGLTINPGLITAPNAPNVVSDKAEFTIDVRYVTNDQIEFIYDTLNKWKDNTFTPDIKVEIVRGTGFPPMIVNSKLDAMVEIIKNVAKSLEQSVEFLEVGGSSDANHISSNGVSTICGCGPIGGYLHNDKEYMEIDSVEKRFQLMYGVILQIASQKN